MQLIRSKLTFFLLKFHKLGIVFLCGLLAGCGSGGSNAQPVLNKYKKFLNKEFGFEITYPESWTITEKSNSIKLHSSMEPGARGYSALVVQIYEPNPNVPTDLATIVNESVIDMEAAMTNFELSEKTPLRVNGTDTYKITFLYNAKGNDVRYQDECYFLFGEHYLYRIIAESVSDDFDKYRKDISSIVNSFKFLK
jgi:hypothetical protein